jgi:hypothetical protein
MTTNGSAVRARTQDQTFITQCSWTGLQERLPLQWPTPPDTPPSPKHAYRSHYVYRGWADLQDPAAWEHLSDFDLALRLVDFTGLRPVLAQRLGWTAARGWCPFDPLSLFLLAGWQLTNRWPRTQALQHLRQPRYADYAQRLGFAAGVYPTEGGMRYFLTALGQHSTTGATVTVADHDQTYEVAIQYLNQLLAGALQVVLEAGLLSPAAWTQALVCPDGMIHDAASRLRCTAVQDSCYQLPTPESPRPCPAKDKGHQGCTCETVACRPACQYATPRDAAARFVWYEGRNQTRDNPNRVTDPAQAPKPRGQGHYGYRSLPLLLADPARRFHLTLLADLRPANAREEVPAAALVQQLPLFYPDLHLEAFVGDAGFGYDVVLHTVYQQGGRRVVDLRHHPTDDDQSQWPVRGYDDQGRPICPFGYALTANGFDSQRQRHKWCCRQTCLHGHPPAVQLADVAYPPPECPYQAADHPHGRIVNVGERFADGSSRLVRDLPVGTPTWKRLYHQARNASEGRHATLEGWDLKRLPVYGEPRGRAWICLADTWATLTTLARLVREATHAAHFI